MRRKWTRYVVRVVVFLLVLAGSAFALRQFRRTRAAADLPVATAKRGEFLVLVRCRGELVAKISEQLAAPLDVQDLQIVWEVPDGGEVRKGDPVIRFDPTRVQQDIQEKTAALQQAQSTLDQATAQARITEDQDKLDLSTAQYNVEKAKLEASKQAIMSKIQGEESGIDLSLAEEKLKVQQAATVTHQKGQRAEDRGARTGPRQRQTPAGPHPISPYVDGIEKPAERRGELSAELLAGVAECPAVQGG